MSGHRLRVCDLRVDVAGSSTDVVDEVSFSVGDGEILGLVGESGSGKTTVALALLGHARGGLQIVSGSVLLDGHDVLAASAADLRRLRGAVVAYVPQDPASALNPSLRIGRQLAEALRAHPGAAVDVAGRIAEVLREARLDPTPDLLRRYPHQLSGGQQQRVAIAMAFLASPALIVLDEPTTGLDVGTQRGILETVRRLCGSYGVAAVYVSHDLAVVSGLVDHVGVMYAGRIVELGPTAAVFRAPAHAYTRGLLAAVPSVDVADGLRGIEGAPPRVAHRPAGCSFSPRCELRISACAEDPPPRTVDGRLVRCVRAHEVLHHARRRGAVAGSDGGLADRVALGVRGLVAGYGEQVVLSGVDLDVPAGSCVALVGESGSGKTTLARAIVGLHAARAGDVTLAGERLAPGLRGRTSDVLRRLQFVFQNPYTSLNPRRTIGRAVAQPLEHFCDLDQREIERRVIAALEDVALGADVLNRYPDQLSGGERQRVAIARALVVEPDVLICDEVTSALDVSVQAVIIELLRRLQRERELSMLFITHNVGLVRSIAQTCVVLAGGEVVEAGLVEQVLGHPTAPYTIGLMEDVPRLDPVASRRYISNGLSFEPNG